VTFAQSAATHVTPVVEAVRAALATTVDRASAPASGTPRASQRMETDAWLAPGDALVRHVEYEAARWAYQAARAQRSAGGALSALDEARYEQRLAQLAILRGLYAQAESRCVGALRALDPWNPIAAAMLEATASLARCFHGDAKGAAEWLDLSRARVSDQTAWSGHPDGARVCALVHRAEGNHLMAAGLAPLAALAYERGLRLCDAKEDAWEHSIALFNTAEALSRTGDLARAEALLDAALRVKTDIDDRWGRAYVHGVRATILVERREPALAARELSVSLELAGTLDDPRLLSMLEATQRHVRLDPDGAALRCA
jgi:tetratricopeptide (TPR) repeat protein